MVAPVVAFGVCECGKPTGQRKGCPPTLYCSEACNKRAYYRRHPHKHIQMLFRRGVKNRAKALTRIMLAPNE